MKLGMPILLEFPNLKAHVEWAKLWGLHFVEINATYPDYQPEVLNAKVLRDYQRAYDMEFTLHLPEDLNPASFHPEVRYAYTKRFKQFFHWAASGGIHMVTMHLPSSLYVSLPERKVFLYDEHFEHYLQWMTAALESVSSLAMHHDIRLCIENCGDFSDKYKQAFLKKAMEYKYVGFTWDIGHDKVSKGSDYAFMEAYQDRIWHLHLHDAKEKNAHLILGKGEVDLLTVCHLAKQKQLKTVIEVKTQEALIRSLSHLQQYL